MADYQAKIDVVPTRESELVELTRDYATLQEAYESLRKKQEDANLARNLERRQIGEHFKILDPASLPERQYNQKQRLLALVGSIAVGLGLGLVLVGFLEYRDSSFKTEADITKVLTLPVLALVPMMESGADHSASLRRRRRINIGLTAVVLLGSAAALTFWKL
jgi:succinoglycan biosynthesis transport protein ExoP